MQGSPPLIFSGFSFIKNMKKQNRWLIIYGIWITILVWLAVTNMIQAFKCPKMTQTELLILLPKTSVLNFTNCD